MPPESPLAPAVRSEAPATYAVASHGLPAAVRARARAHRARRPPPPSKTTSSSASSGSTSTPPRSPPSGGLRELLDDPDDLLHVVLLSPENRARVHALHEVHARWMQARLRRDGGPLTSPARTRRYVEARLRGYRNEVFACLFLDNRHRVIAFEELFLGHPRQHVGLSARRRAPGARAQRRGARVCPQPPLGGRRAEPQRPRPHQAARRSARARRRAPHRPLRGRRRGMRLVRRARSSLRPPDPRSGLPGIENTRRSAWVSGFEQEGCEHRASARQGGGRRAPADPDAGRGHRQRRTRPMFDFDVEVPSGGPDLLALLGLDGRAIRTILEEPAPFDPRGDDRE